MRSGEVAVELVISLFRLQRWTERFAAFLSPSATGNGHGGPREYSDGDLEVLRTILALHEQGLDDDGIEGELLRRGQIHTDVGSRDLVRVEPDGATDVVPAPVAAALGQALLQLSDTQQALLNSQQAQRELLGVVVQDNFNLKEENARLRKRLRQLEEELAHLKESDWNHRLSLEERLAQLERKRGWWERLFGE
ncbi:MAG TPA: MerR family transcriptional regulator [Ardenticatenaceae bacterium]|nr:MerR family transcriptional regulator [Ardenticatenaceae bacterium]